MEILRIFIAKICAHIMLLYAWYRAFPVSWAAIRCECEKETSKRLAHISKAIKMQWNHEYCVLTTSGSNGDLLLFLVLNTCVFFPFRRHTKICRKIYFYDFQWKQSGPKCNKTEIHKCLRAVQCTTAMQLHSLLLSMWNHCVCVCVCLISVMKYF